MDDHLGKPLRGDELATVLSRWLEDEADVLKERLAALDRLGQRTGKQVLEQVISGFLHQGERDLEALRRGLAHGDGAAFAAAAHSLAGSAGILGAARLAAGCAELEVLARRGDLAACEARIESVEQAYRSIAQRLSK
jgi:HPt (histidine-containing phosphotransfer) domain-containing protein